MSIASQSIPSHVGLYKIMLEVEIRAHYALCMYFLLMCMTGLVCVGKGRRDGSILLFQVARIVQMQGTHGVGALRALVF